MVNALLHISTLLEQIVGIGRKHAPYIAKQILEYIGDDDMAYMAEINDIKDLLQNSPLWELLTVETKVELQYKPLREIPRVVIDVVAAEFARIIGPSTSKTSKIWYEICGGYKRGKKISHDVDILICTTTGAATLNMIIDLINKNSRLKHQGIIMHKPFQLGNDEASLLIDVYGSDTKYITIKSDILFAPEEELIFASMHFTGSKEFNVRMRIIANSKGYKLNQRGLFYIDSGARVPIKNERDIFAILNVPWKEPAAR